MEKKAQGKATTEVARFPGIDLDLEARALAVLDALMWEGVLYRFAPEGGDWLYGEARILMPIDDGTPAAAGNAQEAALAQVDREEGRIEWLVVDPGATIAALIAEHNQRNRAVAALAATFEQA